MGKLTPPDVWAKEHVRGPGVKAWADDVPDDIVLMVQQSSASVRALVSWFHSEVAAAYPDEEWPGKATVTKVDRMRRAGQ